MDPAASELTLEEEAPETRAAAESEADESFQAMSLDELLSLEVTTVSRRPQKLAETASAVQVITSEEIRRSGALSLPEALRLAPNLQVAQLNAHDWAITARGFNGAPLPNNALSDKLLVMIDGRSIYTPLFGGVFWDVQHVLLEDVDRIEVISGPGGSLWGANAVNGVINIVTKSARDTQGAYVSTAIGSFWEEYGAARYGGQLADNLYYRVYGLGFQHDNTKSADGSPINDEWQLAQGGFRLDYYPSPENTLTVQGDIYDGQNGEEDRVNPITGGPDHAEYAGGNLLARWTRVFSNESELIAQFYFDATDRHLPNGDYGYDLRTYDLDIQHRFPLAQNHSILWGGGYRVTRDDQDNSLPLALDPERRTLDLFNVFVQDEITLVPRRLKLTIGSKLEHNDYSGFELQPSARLAWTPVERQTIWGAVSRAVRSPARLDADVTTPLIVGGRNFDSEKVVAYELGYRVRPIDPLSLSVATFYNRYTDLRSINANPAPPPALVFANDQEADSWGVELSGDLQLAPWWRLRGGYTYFDKSVDATDPTVVPGSDTFEGNDPQNQVVLQSLVDLPYHFQFDVVGRYVDALSSPAIDSYISVDVRVAWHYRNVELSVVGQNLLDELHPEFGSQEIPRSVYGRMTLRW